MRNASWWNLLVLGTLGVGCGRTSLLSPSPADTQHGGSAAGGGKSLPSFGGVGNAGAPPSLGGSFGIAGTSTAGGTFAAAGSPAGGVSTGGAPSSDDCRLAVGDCRLPDETECAQHPSCDGGVVGHLEFGEHDAQVLDIAVSTSGSVAIVGAFRGSIDFGGKSKPLISQDSGDTQTDGFVALFDFLGSTEWSHAFGGEGSQLATGVHFASNGDVVVQGALKGVPVANAPGAFVSRLDGAGHELWNWLGGNADILPGRVGCDNDGNIVLSGSFANTLSFAGATLSGPNLDGYLIKLNPDGKLLWARDVLPDGWRFANVTSVAVDDEDNIVVAGNGQRGDGNFAAFFRKLGSNGDPALTEELFATGGIRLWGVAVDREMRPLVVGDFRGRLTSYGETYESSSPTGGDLWVAAYTRQGDLAWQRVVASGGKGALARGVAVDPFGNVVVSGVASGIELDGELSVPDVARAKYGVYVLKLRPDSDTVWLRWFEGASSQTAVATNNQGNVWLAGAFTGKFWVGADVAQSLDGSQAYLLELSP